MFPLATYYWGFFESLNRGPIWWNTLEWSYKVFVGKKVFLTLKSPCTFFIALGPIRLRFGACHSVATWSRFLYNKMPTSFLSWLPRVSMVPLAKGTYPIPDDPFPVPSHGLSFSSGNEIQIHSPRSWRDLLAASNYRFMDTVSFLC